MIQKASSVAHTVCVLLIISLDASLFINHANTVFFLEICMQAGRTYMEFHTQAKSPLTPRAWEKERERALILWLSIPWVTLHWPKNNAATFFPLFFRTLIEQQMPTAPAAFEIWVKDLTVLPHNTLPLHILPIFQLPAFEPLTRDLVLENPYQSIIIKHLEIGVNRYRVLSIGMLREIWPNNTC